MTDQRMPRGAEPTVLLAAGPRGIDPAALWTALLEIASPDARPSDTPQKAPVDGGRGDGGLTVSAVTGIDASIARMQALLDGGHERLLVVPVGVVADQETEPPDWQAPLAAAVDALRAAYPAADINDLGRAAHGPEASTVADLIANPRNDSPSMLAGAIARGFGGDPAGLAAFIARLRTALPPETTIALRGSAVVGHRHADGPPFDADGPGTSDLDVVAVGETVVDLWVPDARLLGGINTLPLYDGAPWVAPTLDGARRQAQAVVGRPLSIQAMAGWFLDLRAVVQGHPYVILSAPS